MAAIQQIKSFIKRVERNIMTSLTGVHLPHFKLTHLPFIIIFNHLTIFYLKFFYYKGYYIVGKYKTNGSANGCTVIRGPKGGEYYISPSGRPTFIGHLWRYQIVYF